MTLQDVQTIIDRANTSIVADQKKKKEEQNLDYQKTITEKVEKLQFEICLDQDAQSLNEINPDTEIKPYLAKMADELEIAI